MPLPENSRITIPRFTPESVGDHYGNNRELDRWAANLPFFKQYTHVLRSVGATTFTSTSWNYFPYGTLAGGPQVKKFKKFEKWTGVNVRVGVQIQISNNNWFQIGVRFTESKTGGASRDYWINEVHGKSASDHRTLAGEITIDGFFFPPSGATYFPSDINDPSQYYLDTTLLDGTYNVYLVGRIQSGGTVTLDQYDNCFLSIIETY